MVSETLYRNHGLPHSSSLSSRMTLFLHFSDPALREAVAEQIAASSIDDVRDWQKDVLVEGDLVVTDASALFGAGSCPATILLIGEAGESDAVNESFAKPVRLGHLMARIRHYLQTAPLLRNGTLVFGPWKLEPQNRSVIRGGETVRLTEKETALLAFLARAPQPVTRRDILAEVWGYDERIDTHTLETHLYQLRRKLGEKEGETWLIAEAGAYRLAKGQA
jgi:hypothetical protein